MLIIAPRKGDIFLIFFNIKACCVFSLESSHPGNSNEHTQYTIFIMKKENHPRSSQIRNYRIFSSGPKNDVETAVVNEPSVFEPLNFFCSYVFK